MWILRAIGGEGSWILAHFYIQCRACRLDGNLQPALPTYNDGGMKGLRQRTLTVIPPLLAALFSFLPGPLARSGVASLPQPTDYVSDFAHVLSPEAIARLDSICQQLDHSAANAQIAVVTVHDLNGDDAADYADQLEDHWKMGNKGDNRYAMVLLAVADHKYRIEVGYGLEGILPDGKTGDIGRDMVPDLKASDYDGAVTLAVGEVAQVIADDAKITLDDQDQLRAATRRNLVQQRERRHGKTHPDSHHALPFRRRLVVSHALWR